MSEPSNKPDSAEKPETPGQKRERHKAMTLGIVLGGVIGVTLGLIVVSTYRGCTAEKHSPPEAPIKALPPRPVKTTPTT
jgi:hypothetical protein